MIAVSFRCAGALPVRKYFLKIKKLPRAAKTLYPSCEVSSPLQFIASWHAMCVAREELLGTPSAGSISSFRYCVQGGMTVERKQG